MLDIINNILSQILDTSILICFLVIFISFTIVIIGFMILLIRNFFMYLFNKRGSILL